VHTCAPSPGTAFLPLLHGFCAHGVEGAMWIPPHSSFLFAQKPSPFLMPHSLTRTTPCSANRKLANFLFLLWILGLFPQFGHAQEVAIRPGVRAGLAMTTQGGEDVPPSLGWRTGASVGALAEVNLSDAFAVQPEFAYVRKGAAGIGNGISLDRRLDYIQIPLLAKYRFSRFRSLTPELFAGPFVAFNVKAEETLEFDGRSDTRTPANIRTTEAGLTVGTGLQWRISVGEVRLDARYVFGLNSTKELTDDIVRNQGILVSVGYLF